MMAKQDVLYMLHATHIMYENGIYVHCTQGKLWGIIKYLLSWFAKVVNLESIEARIEPKIHKLDSTESNLGILDSTLASIDSR